MLTSPDPITQGTAYQQHLLSLLGGDDPAWVQETTPGTLRALLDEAGPELRRRPAPKEWSVLELLGHLTDGEMVMSGRYRWALAQDRPPLLGYDQDLWVDQLRHNDDDPADLFAVFTALRASNLRLWRASSMDDRGRVALHNERGPESYELMFRMIAGHDRFHLNQMRQSLSQVRAAQVST